VKGVTRRSLLAVGPALFGSFSLAGSSPSTRSSPKKTKPLPATGEFVRFVDPTTESVVVRLTDPSHTSLLPKPTNHFISVKERFLVFSSDRAGRPAPYRLDLRTGIAAVIDHFDTFVPSSLCLDPSGRSVYLLDGMTLKEVSFGAKRSRIVEEGVSAFGVGGSEKSITFVKNGELRMPGTAAQPLAKDVAAWCLVRPGDSGCLFQRGSCDADGELWYAPMDVRQKPLLIARGPLAGPVWSPDGSSVLFLRNTPSASGVLLSEIHELSPEGGPERKVSSTSQFAAFAPNGDGSVFVGASRSKAQPTIILLLRSLQRELTLCEHRASHPAAVAPVFSPDSRRVYFESDHQGKTALYSVNVEQLVEPTNATA